MYHFNDNVEDIVVKICGCKNPIRCDGYRLRSKKPQLLEKSAAKEDGSQIQAVMCCQSRDVRNSGPHSLCGVCVCVCVCVCVYFLL